MDATGLSGKAKILCRVRNVRDSWSPSERRRRAVKGRRKFKQFVRLIADPIVEGEIWAAGALTSVDFERLAREN